MKFSILCFPPLLLLATPSYADSQKDWDTASNIGAFSLAAISIGIPVVENDKNGAFQAAGSITAAQLVSQGLKYSFPEVRPDGSDRKSFPSAHTATAFAAAASIYERQGPKLGVPAFIVAGLVGVARVKADKHFWYDAVAGAGIGLTAGLLITNKLDRNFAVVPYGDTKSGGVFLAMRF